MIDRPTVDNPTGQGDPDAVTCGTRKVVSRPTDWEKKYSPVLCRPNSFWADVIKNNKMVTLNGDVVSRPMGGIDFGSGREGQLGFGSSANGPGDSGRASQSSATP